MQPVFPSDPQITSSATTTTATTTTKRMANVYPALSLRHTALTATLAWPPLILPTTPRGRWYHFHCEMKKWARKVKEVTQGYPARKSGRIWSPTQIRRPHPAPSPVFGRGVCVERGEGEGPGVSPDYLARSAAGRTWAKGMHFEEEELRLE